MRKVSPVAQFFGCAVVCMIFSAIMPVMGVFSAAVLPAVYGVCLAATPNAIMAIAPVPGLILNYLLWRSPATAVIGLLLVLPGIALAVCLRKKMSVTGTCVVCTGTYVFIFAAAFAAVMIYFYGSVPEGIRAFTDFVSQYLTEILARAKELGGGESAYLAQISPEAYAAAMVMLIPGSAIVFCEILSYVISLLARLTIRTFPVPEELYPTERRITVPASTAVLFLLSFVITVFSSSDAVYYTVQNLNTVLQPPLFVMGVRSLAAMLKGYGGRRGFLILFIIVIFVISPQVGTYSVCCAGMLNAFAEYFARRKQK